MFLEKEVYSMLNWGFVFVMLVELSFFILLWLKHRFDKFAFSFFLVHIFLFSLAGNYLLNAIEITEVNNPMGSEEASILMAAAGLFWLVSVLFLLSGVGKIVWKSNGKSLI